MKTVNVADAKAHLSELLNRIAHGGDVVITRRGQPVARLSAIEQPGKPIDFRAMDSLRARQPATRSSSVTLLRRMRNAKY